MYSWRLIHRTLTIRFVNLLRYASALLMAEYNNWILWYPMWVCAGISIYIILPFEPSFIKSSALSILIAALSCTWHQYSGNTAKFIARMLFFMALGFLMIIFKVHFLDKRSIHEETFVTIKGTIDQVDHLASSDRLFQRIIISHIENPDLPRKVSVSIKTDDKPLEEGMIVRLRAVLSPAKEPAFPGGYDFAMHSFFNEIGARGYSVSDVSIEKDTVSEQRIKKLRNHLTRELHRRFAPPIGAIACALVTGDKASIPKQTRIEFSQAGISHILAISGLHMSLVISICFLIFFRGFAWIKNLPLYVNLSRLASIISLIVGYMYLQISGAGFPAKRAFIMLAFSITANLLARRPISLRSIALAAIIIIAMDPSAVYSISFQLSFAAVIGLSAFYSSIRRIRRKTILGRIGVFFMGLLGSTLVATAATMPFLMYYFHQISAQSIIANILAIPITSFLVVPLGIVSLASLAISGTLADFVFPLLGESIALLNLIAKWCYTFLPSLVFYVPPYDTWVFAISIAGGAWICIIQNQLRYLGFIPFIACTILPLFYEMPVYLVSPEKKVIGMLDHKILWVSSKRKGRFAIDAWKSAFGAIDARVATDHATKFPMALVDTLSDEKSHIIYKNGDVKSSGYVSPRIWNQ